MRLSVVSLVLLLFCAGLACGSPVPVQGDASLLQVLRDVQQTNLDSFASGRLTGTAVETLQQREQQSEFKFELIWSKDRAFWRLKGRQFEKGSLVKEDDEVLVDTPEIQMRYTPSLNRFGSAKKSAKKNMPRAYEVQPPRAWYYFRTRSWATMLDPDFATESLDYMSVSKSDSNLVEVLKAGKGFTVSITCDLGSGGNVVRYATETQDGTPMYKGNYSWVKCGTGHRMTSHTSETLIDGKVAQHCEVKIADFDPGYRVTDKQFTMEAMEIANGTDCYVQVAEGERHYKKGAEPPDPARMRELGKLLREMGFINGPSNR